jgi:hypothetical protein
VRKAIPYSILACLLALAVGAALLASASHSPGGSAQAAPTLDPLGEKPSSVWSLMATSPEEPGLWKCATAQSKVSLANGAILKVTWGKTTLTVAYVGADGGYNLGPHAWGEAAFLSVDDDRYAYGASLGPIDIEGLVDPTPGLHGACLIKPSPRSPVIGIIGYDDTGTWCCTTFRLLEPGPKTTTATTLRVVTLSDDLTEGAHLEDLEGDLVIRLTQLDFLGAFTDDADSSMPIELLALRNNRLVDVTADHPKEVRADAAAQWKIFVHRRHGFPDPKGVLPSWMADECRLGRGQAAWKTMLHLERNGVFARSEYAPNPNDLTYLSDVASSLHNMGLCTDVQLPA